jgi:beta-galactosidase GanA
VSPAQNTSLVTYTPRSIVLGDTPTLLLVGSIHYPRSVPTLWPQLLHRAKSEGNLNAIDTYVFWNLHEPSEGVWDFESEKGNLVLFLKTAKQVGLHVVLRVGPYVCAEWNNGGLPSWLLQKPGIKLRTYDEQFMFYMERFIRNTLEVVEPFMWRNGGPVVLLQMENEYKTFIWETWPLGHRYIHWAAALANK